MRPETKADIIAFGQFLKWVGLIGMMIVAIPLIAAGAAFMGLAWLITSGL